MTVGELREALERLPQEAEVFTYNMLDECDARIDTIELRDTAEMYHDECYNEDVIYSPHYCQGDSHAEAYWRAKGPNVPVVFLVGTDRCVDYTKE